MSPSVIGRSAGLALVLSLAASCGSSSDSPPDDGNGDGGGNGNTDFTVSVRNNSFSPATLTVPLGTTVTWTWASGATGHNVVGDDAANPESSGAFANAPHSYDFRFVTPGTFRYHCQSHGAPGGSGMAGTIVVE
jgi:plastocyanin